MYYNYFLHHLFSSFTEYNLTEEQRGSRKIDGTIFLAYFSYPPLKYTSPSIKYGAVLFFCKLTKGPFCKPRIEDFKADVLFIQINQRTT